MKQVSNLDPLDRRILQELQADASLSHAELAERVGSTAPSCWRRIRAMEQAGVLLRTVRLVEAEKLGYPVNVICNVRMRDYLRESIERFEAFVDEQGCILECFMLSGDWDYLIRVIAENVTEYENFLMRSLLRHPSVAGASSNFALSVKKQTTAIPV